jgi:CTP:molybdopterin cytidylyltransferase MocA
MGQFKPLLPVAGRTAIERSIATFRDAGLRDVVVVLGHRRAH